MKCRFTSRKNQKQTCSFNRVVSTMCLFSIRYPRFKRGTQSTLSQIQFVLSEDNPASSVCLVQMIFIEIKISTHMSQHPLLTVLAKCVAFLKHSVAPDRFSTDTDTDRMETGDNQITCSACGSHHVARWHSAVDTHRGCDCRLFRRQLGAPTRILRPGPSASSPSL